MKKDSDKIKVSVDLPGKLYDEINLLKNKYPELDLRYRNLIKVGLKVIIERYGFVDDISKLQEEIKYLRLRVSDLEEEIKIIKKEYVKW